MNENICSIAFTGDIGFDGYMDKKWEDEELLSPDILKFLADADHVIANVEGPVSNANKKMEDSSVASLMHTIHPDAVKVLNDIHADIWNINNNHIMDAGAQGVEDTINIAKQNNALTVGAGMNLKEASKPVFFEEGGGIGVFSVGYRRGCKPADENKAGCLLWTDLEIIQKNINDIKNKCRWCVMIVHGGEEFTSLPSPYTRDRYLMFLDMGADIIVCHHPHVVMNYELFPDKAIFYSLGNFIFDTDYQRSQFYTEKGVLLKLFFSENEFDFEALGIQIDREKEHISADVIPKIFQEVDNENYEKLSPLSAKAFIAATKRQQIFLNPKDWKDASKEQWEQNFFNPKRSGRVPGEALDLTIIYPFAALADTEERWKESELEDVKDYIISQL